VIATMAQPAPGAGIYYLPPFEAAARAFGIEPVEAPVRAQHKGVRHEHHAALLRQSRERGDDVGGINRDIIITQAASNLVPAIYPYRFSATSGGLMSYGVGLAEQNQEAASYVNRILKGEKPGNLPVQLPTQFDS